MTPVNHRILMDARPLLDERGGGVFEYSRRLADNLEGLPGIRLEKWANRFAPAPVDVGQGFDAMTRWPNKILHAGARFVSRPRFDRLSGIEADIFWAPNPHFISLSDGMPFVLTMHDLSFERYPEFFSPKQRLWHKAVDPKALCRRARKILAVSTHTKRDIVDLYGIDPDRIVVTHEGCDERYRREPSPESIEEVRTRLALPKHFILHVGTLEPRKNHLGLLAAFDLLKKDAKFSDLHLVMAGPPGWSNAGIRRAIASSPNRDRIRTLGFIGESDKPALYRLAHAFVFPSFYEGFGLPPLEAMASGTPTIASFAASLGEIVGDAGLLVDPYRPAEIADAIASVLESPSLRAELSARGRERAKRFTWEACAEETAEAFREVLGR